MNLVFASGVLIPQTIGPFFKYFRGLRELDPNAFFPSVSGIRTVPERAKQLADQISARFPTGQIHIIAHSMGGLDVRCLIAQDMKDLKHRIASLSTIGTPHRGSPIADLVKAQLAGGFIKGLIDGLLGGREDALDDLTTESVLNFNNQNHDFEGTKYYSYAGHSASAVLTPTHNYIADHAKTAEERTNDGFVSIASAKWPTELTEHSWEADHFALIGHDVDTFDLAPSFKHIDAYRRVVQRATGQTWP